MKLDWNRERHRTRDLLLEYDFDRLPARPHTAGLNIIYPWEDTNLHIFAKELYQLVLNNGFTGTLEQFLNRFCVEQEYTQVVKGTVNTFPMPGIENNLYLDIETSILYYFKITNAPINPELVNKIGAIMTTDEDKSYLYIPVRAMLIEDIILNGGSAAEYID